MSNEIDPPHRYGLVSFLNEEGHAVTMLTEVFLNERGEVWSFLPTPVAFISMTGIDILAELEQAINDCRASPILDAAQPLADPPANLVDEIRREQLIELVPPTKSRH